MMIHLHKRRFGALPALCLALALAGQLGCSQRSKAEAQAIAKAAVAASQAVGSYYDEGLAKHDESRAALAFYTKAEADPDDPGFAKLRKALKARVEVADALEELTSALSKIVDYDPDGAKKAAQDLVSSIEKLNGGHPLDWPRVTVAGQGINPEDYGYTAQRILDKAVIALVEAQKEREFKRVLPKLAEAVRAILQFLDADRKYVAEVVADCYSLHFLNSEQVVQAGLAIDLKMIESATTNFDLLVLPQSLGIITSGGVRDDTREQLRLAVLVKMQTRLHELIRKHIDSGGKVSTALFNLYITVAKKTNTRVSLLPSKDEIRTTEVLETLAKLRQELKDDPKKRVREPKTWAQLEVYVLQGLAMRLTPGEVAQIEAGKATAEERRTLLANLLSGAILGSAIVDVAMTKNFTDDPNLSAVETLVTKASPSFEYLGLANAEKSRLRSSGSIEPAGLALAELNKAVLTFVMGKVEGGTK